MIIVCYVHQACTHDYCDEYEVKANAQAMLDNGMHAIGFEYVLLDDCWGYGRDPATNQLQWDNDRFPSGMPALADWLHERGLKFGLYTSLGDETCNSGGHPFPIPGSEGYFEIDAQTFASWGVDHVKMDWCGDVKDQFFIDGYKHGKDYQVRRSFF
jgi:alpha-galactosidase